jgi:phosphodiesterase/alkaline phosphatase D-like protein
MHRLLLTLALTVTVGGLLASTPTVAQVYPPRQVRPAAEIPPPAKKAKRVEITQGPALEGAREGFAIIRWTTNNPGGTDDHFAVVYYGTDPKDLSQMAKSHIRINRDHPETIFRVRMSGLKPRTTYYYKVTSTESNGQSDGVESPVKQFTTPGPGQRAVNYPPQPARSR